MQHQTVPQTTPALAFAGFAPGENRKLLADVHRWARTNGWTWHECWGWVNAPYASDATLAVEWDNERPGVLTIRTGPVVFRPKHYDVDSVRQAVDQLVTLGILPDRFATSYGLGVAAGLDQGEQEHRLAAGSAGGPGENSAECACGVTYAGFDTHREATELLDRHITEETKPAALDYWLNLAADLRQAADRITTLAGTRKPDSGSRLVFYCGLSERDHLVNRPVVDAVAAAFGGTAKEDSDRPRKYAVDATVGSLEVWGYAYIPASEDAEKAALAARVAELEAQLAEGGATR